MKKLRSIRNYSLDKKISLLMESFTENFSINNFLYFNDLTTENFK